MQVMLPVCALINSGQPQKSSAIVSCWFWLMSGSQNQASGLPTTEKAVTSAVIL
jgi:hypothetical protein